jgi:hypothetical protein
MQLLLNLFIFTDALHVSGRSTAHHQEHIKLQIPEALRAPDDGRWNGLKHVERL